MRPELRKNWLCALLICAVVLVAYWPAYTAGFLWDDYTMVTDSALLRGPLRLIWFSAVPADYFPLTYSSLWVEWRLWGENPMGYHIVNVVLHALSCVIFWRVLVRLKLPGAFLAAMLFAVHPVNVESVAWVAERKNALAMVFYMLTAWSFVCFAQTRKLGFYVLSLGAFLLSLLAKTSVVAWPVVAVGIFYFCQKTSAKQNATQEKPFRAVAVSVVWVLPFFLVSLGLGLLTIWFQYHRAIGNDVIHHHDFLTRLAGAGCAVWFYLWKALVPYPLSFVYPMWNIDSHSLAVFLPAIALVVAVGVLLWRRASWSNAVLWGLIYFVLLLAPVLGFINIYFQRYSYVADHWQYFALPAVTVLVALALTRVKLQQTVGVVLVAVFAVMTFARARVYHDEETIWQDTLAKNPNCWVAYNNLAYLRQHAGNTAAACELYEKSISIFPDQAEAHNNLGCALLNTDRTTEALEHLQTASRINPDYPTVYYLLGSGYQRLGKTAEAIDAYRNAIRSEPKYSPAYNNLACLLLMEGKRGDAESLLRRALELNDEYAEAMVNLGAILNDTGRQQEAVPLLKKSVRIIPNNPDGHLNLANALFVLKDISGARDEYSATLEINPHQYAAHYGLASCLAKSGQATAAMKHYQLAIEENPAHVESHYQLAVLLAANKQKSAAIEHLREVVRLKPDWTIALNNMAWAMATDQHCNAIDSATAVRLAEHAVELTRRSDPSSLDTLAAAWARSGAFSKASETAALALELASKTNQTNLTADIQQRLALYKRQTAYTEQ